MGVFISGFRDATRSSAPICMCHAVVAWLYRALSPRSNPTLKTLLALLNATGMRLGVHA